MKTHQCAKELIEKTKTEKGLKVTVEILDKLYQTGRQYAADFKENMRIVFDQKLGKWNYTVVPQ